MNNEELALYTRLLKRKNSLIDKPFFNLDKSFENHHYLGRINSEKTFYIHKQRHDFITKRTNFLSRSLRQQQSIAFLTNVVGGLELLAFELEHVIFRTMNSPSWQTLEKQLNLRGLSVDEITIILSRIMKMMQYEKR